LLREVAELGVHPEAFPTGRKARPKLPDGPERCHV